MQREGASRYEVEAVLNCSREERAEAVLDALERTAREIRVAWDDEGYEDGQFMKRCVARVQRDLRLMLASAQADPTRSQDFYKVLLKSQMMRCTPITTEYKNGVRVQLRCMCCGRKEENNHYRVGLAGYFDQELWFSGAENLQAAYWDSERQYARVAMGEDDPEFENFGELHGQDYGDYMLGEQCMRKAKLVHAVLTFLLSRARKAKQRIERLHNLGGFDERESELFTVTPAAAARWLVDFDNVSLCVADERRTLPYDLGEEASASSQRFWSEIDELRNAAAAGIAKDEVELVRSRSKFMLRMVSQSSEEEEEEGSDSEDMIVTEKHRSAKKRQHRGPRNEGPGRPAIFCEQPRKRKRRAVEESEDEEEEETASGGADCTYKHAGATRRQSRRLQKLPVEVADGVDGRRGARQNAPVKRPSKPSKENRESRGGEEPGVAVGILQRLTELKLRMLKPNFMLREEDSATLTAAMAAIESVGVVGVP